MGFYRFDKDDGTSWWAHVRLGKKPEPVACVFRDFTTPDERCGRMSVALCDGPAGSTLGGAVLTCDAPMCEKHRTSIGPDRDLCPRCVTKRDQAKANAAAV